MHAVNVITLFVLLTLVGAEFAVAAFVDPAAWRLELKPQATFLSRFAAVLGKAMPVWYAAGLVLLLSETWAGRHTSGFPLLLAATAVWLLATLGSILFLVPLNNRVVASGAGWHEAHRAWDARHRVRVAALAAAGVLFALVVVR